MNQKHNYTFFFQKSKVKRPGKKGNYQQIIINLKWLSKDKKGQTVILATPTR